MYKQLILLLGLLLGSHLPAAAQTPAPQIVLAQDRIAPMITMVRTAPATLLAASLPLPVDPGTSVLRAVSAPLLAVSFPLPVNPGISAAHFSYQFAEPYESNQGLEGLESQSQMSEVKTLFLTRSSLPLVQLWGGRLRLEGFTSTLNVQNVLLGPSGGGGLQDFRPWRPSGLGVPGSLDFSGVSLTFHFGRNAQIGRPTQIWRRVARIVGTAR